MFVNILKGTFLPYSFCSQGAEVAIGELKVHKQDLTSLKSMEAQMGCCMIVGWMISS